MLNSEIDLKIVPKWCGKTRQQVLANWQVVEVAGDDDDEDNEWFVFADQIQREKKPAACVRMNVLWM